ncbi:hypothetical protein DCS_01377 [Drechmeria coniospora]|uniref:Large ribosomal subunit protein mL50 n=1 Tax=Drechmeria coniospora TaxID=98403 RepID=A0A151GT41_DRECN|nr:hypothetical protein DCS_01377 [Drechmeria coniospora]KYK60240.1 hypothetical protein DCS_01377 [Drechmeria coniospora]ODA80182.1 hypothetical protein RJ55_03140 [Drechmeria coniospora]
MARAPRLSGLQSLHLQLAIAPLSWSSTRSCFVRSRAISTTCAARGKNTDWVRGKLWKDEAPGPEDPYTQRPEEENVSKLPEEVLQSMPRRDRTPAAVRDSRLVLPPKRTEAMSEKELKASDPTYAPATDASGLEEIETVRSWWHQPGHWGEESDFRPFASTEKVADKDVIEVYLRRAVVEVLALQEAGSFSPWSTKKWRAGDRNALDEALAVEIQIRDGKPSLKGNSSSVCRALTSEAEEAAEAVEKVSQEEARKLIKAWDPSWKDVSLGDEEKFAVRKRLYQLTGNLIPDSKLGAARTVKHLLTLTAKPTKAPKLAEQLRRRDDLRKLTNVELHDSKIGPIQKEMAIGRWKVIEAELKKRNLPVTGAAGLSKNKERDWLTGKM